MSNVNPYAPPQAAVADVYAGGGEVQPVSLWSSQGRIGRLRFLAYLTGAYLLFAFAGGVLAGLLGAFAGSRVTMAVMALGGVAYLAFTIFKAIQRSHDMGWGGWTVILMIIPFVAFIWLLNPGTPGANRFGAPPPPNTLGVKILGWMFPVIMLIGVLAAIALPAYQDYVKRTKTVQVR
ncbi:DUF805 domain-containing protein [Ramlibacter sp. G-1-2-2]|uniref:DUF805 domain-containing protein n=1 Tax=Ramlibacter agri TaxID=2728837 RepID=A0A848H4Z9_9BURK|nr:DUF805 domain-containing protein [Ramlibacter agri]NML43683.1 DUF805 domain-containing protein [Ramlibacter agri]